MPSFALWELAKIDPDVVAGVSQASAVVDGAHVVDDSYSGFMAYIEGYGGELLSPGNVNRLSGYVGEQRVQGLLEAQGDNVQMALTANNPGWDLLVNGAEANVKTYQDATNALRYAEQDPHTHFYLPEDAGHQAPLDNVTYLPGFNAEDIRQSFADSIESAQSLMDGGYIDDAAFGGIPVVLLAVTAYKQTILVREGKRLDQALKDGFVDVGVRAVGAIAGLKAGALTGGAVDAAAGFTTFGIGTAGGAILGGIAGSRLGAWALKEYRLGPLRAAESELIEALEDYGMALDESNATDLLFDAINAPLDRVAAVGAHLKDFVDGDRRSVRWWLWPGADQVLREAAFEEALDDYEETSARVIEVGEFWNEVLVSPGGAASAGLVFANIPELAAAARLDTIFIARIEAAKKRVADERNELARR